MGQYFENVNLPSKVVEYTTSVFGVNFYFKTDNGVFSKDKLDFGTRVLLESLPLSELSGDILDLGCGYGAVSIILSKMIHANFDAVDVNKRALHLLEMNKKRNFAFDVNAFESDIYQNVIKKYDYIITNPPIRAGKKVIYDMLIGARCHLKNGGSLFFVMRKDQGAKSAMKDLEPFYKIDIINKKNGFFVIRCNLD